MSRVITFSTTYPSYHPRKKQKTLFVEKLIESFLAMGNVEITDEQLHLCDFSIMRPDVWCKWTTIRAGHRWKVGDWFSPRVWGNDINPKSGKSGPYHSKQIIISPDIQVKKVWDFEIKDYRYKIGGKYIGSTSDKMFEVAKNDGLTNDDMHLWFRYPRAFDGQIICWNENIEY